MNYQDFIDFLKAHNDNFEFIEDIQHNGKKGVVVKNMKFETETHLALDAIESGKLDLLVAMTTHGKNVEHITRVTGFFSKVEGWNKGKRGELAQRKRNTL